MEMTTPDVNRAVLDRIEAWAADTGSAARFDTENWVVREVRDGVHVATAVGRSPMAYIVGSGRIRPVHQALEAIDTVMRAEFSDGADPSDEPIGPGPDLH
jgi:hypothetical protein